MLAASLTGATAINPVAFAIGEDIVFTLSAEGGEKPQRELVRAAHAESLEFDGVTVEGVEVPCARSWGGVVAPSARELHGVEPKVVDADVPFRVNPI